MKIILCIDLEASCDEGATMKDRGLECIEIGIIALDETGKEVSRFRSYVQPEYVPITDYSTSVNQITETMVEDAPFFAEMIILFMTWARSLPAYPTTWYSWGKYDANQIEMDCRRARIMSPFPKHIDAKMVFQKRNFKRSKRVGLNKALELMGLEFEGRKHSAVDDAHNLARLYEYFVEKKEV